jgi:periplasmic protein TonB
MSNILITALVASLMLASSAEAQGNADQAFLEFQVERAVRVRQAAKATYPEKLRNAGLEGEVLVQFVVNESGVAQMHTFKILKTNDPAFSEAVRRAVSNSSFYPAELDGKKVKQLVQQPYRFQSGK